METKKKKFRVESLGCRTNQYEAQAFHDQLSALGYEPAGKGEEADLCIVNTCTVTEAADSSSRSTIRQIIKKNPQAKVAVTGCFAERNPQAVQEIAGVTYVVPNREKETLLTYLLPDIEELPEFSIRNFDAHTRAFVKVQEGCESFCTYCILPYVRGKSKSRRVEEIVKEVEQLIANGYQEIVLTGTNIGDFDGGVEQGQTPVSLATLVKEVDQIPGVKRLRVSSIDPNEVDEALLDAVIHGKNTCPSMHIVLQSGSNIILKRMNRKYKRQDFMKTVDLLKGARCTVTTDIIVGFPGETEADFQETLDVMDEVHFAKVHMFPYSERPRTRAALYPNKVPQEVIRARKQIVLKLAEKHAFELRNQAVGQTLTILTEASEGDFICGHSEDFLEVMIKSKDLQPNQLVTVRCVDNSPKGLIGELIL